MGINFAGGGGGKLAGQASACPLAEALGVGMDDLA